MHRGDAHRAVRGGKVEDAEVRHHAAQVVEAAGARAGGCRPVVADPADDVDRGHERARVVVGDPVGGGVVDRVARCPAHPDELGLGLGVVADGGDVLVAELVDLAGHHHDVAPSGPDDGEDRLVGHVGLAHEFGGLGGEGGDAVDQRRLAVGEDEVRGEGRLGQPGAEGRDRAEGAGHDLAIAAPGLGAGDRADVCSGDVAHCSDLQVSTAD